MRDLWMSVQIWKSGHLAHDFSTWRFADILCIKMVKAALFLGVIFFIVCCSTSHGLGGRRKLQNLVLISGIPSSIKFPHLQQTLLIRGGKKKKTVGIFQNILNEIKGMFRLWFYPSKPSVSVKTKKDAKNAKKASTKSAANVGDSKGSMRLQKEIQSFMASPPHNCKLSVGQNIRSWVVTLKGVEGTVFAGEEYKLKLIFPKEYPSKPPSVYFLKPVPRHQHVYSNGDICLNLLGRDWSPAMTAEGLVVSILSMLSSAKEKGLPQDNAMHADSAPGKQQDNWMYHDDKC
ncbi:ubiquitin-conjugating enzyme family protein [archaeon]|nr:MAG: ubiquitin-conjugating enzyme family protein [archaeon]